MTGEINLRDLAAGQACQNPEAFQGFSGLKAQFLPDPEGSETILVSVEQDPDSITAPNEIHRARWAFEVYGQHHPDELTVVDLTPPSHFKPAGNEAEYAVVRAKATVAQQIAGIFSRGKVTVDPALERLFVTA